MRAAIKIPPGLVSDDTTFATPGRWEDGNNMRPVRGQMQTIGGWTSLLTGLTGVCRNMLAWTNNAGALNIAFGTHSALQVTLDGTLYTITPTGLATGATDGAPGTGYGAGPYDTDAYGTARTMTAPRTWALSNYGQTLIANPSGGTIYQWSNNTAVVAAAVTNAPARVSYALVTPERQILAFGCNEEVSGTYNPLCIRGSDIEAPTTWTTSATNNAFEHILEGGGRIVAAQLIGAFVAVWTDNALYLGQFVGALGQAYRFDRVAENCGLIGPNAVTVLNQTAYWVGPDYQFRRWAPGGTPEILPCPIRNDFKDNIATDQREKIVAATISTFDEVWWHYPDSRDGNENSRYVAFSTGQDAWFRGQIGRTAAVDSGVAGYPVMATSGGEVFYHETGRTANGGVLSWHIKSSDQYLGEAERCLSIRGVWPDFEDQEGSITLTVSLRQYPQSTATDYTYTLTDGLSKKDFRATGRVASLKFAGASSPSFARIGKPSFDAVVSGAR